MVHTMAIKEKKITGKKKHFKEQGNKEKFQIARMFKSLQDTNRAKKNGKCHKE